MRLGLFSDKLRNVLSSEVLTKYSRLQEQQMSEGVVQSSIATSVHDLRDEDEEDDEEVEENSDVDISVVSADAPLCIPSPSESSASVNVKFPTEVSSPPESSANQLHIPMFWPLPSPSSSLSRAAVAVDNQAVQDEVVVVISDEEEDACRPRWVVDLDSKIGQFNRKDKGTHLHKVSQFDKPEKDKIQSLPSTSMQFEATNLDSNEEHPISLKNRYDQDMGDNNQPASVGKEEAVLTGPFILCNEDEEDQKGNDLFNLSGPILPIEEEEEEEEEGDSDDYLLNCTSDVIISKSPLPADIHCANISSVVCLDENTRKRKGAELEAAMDSNEEGFNASKRSRPDHHSSPGSCKDLEFSIISPESVDKEEVSEKPLNTSSPCSSEQTTTKDSRRKSTISSNQSIPDIINLDSDDDDADDDDDDDEPEVVGCSWSPAPMFSLCPLLPPTFLFPRASVSGGSSLVVSAQQRVSFASAGSDQFGRPQMQINVQREQRRQIIFPNNNPSVFPPCNNY